MKMTVELLLQQSHKLFEKQYLMLPLWQTLSENFYPERADFTDVRNVGTELADTLIDSYPILARRDMANSLSAMLRDGDWFQVGVDLEPDHAGNSWLQWASSRMYKFFSDRNSNFVRATKEGDHDYTTFGQAVISVELNKQKDGLLYRCWHLRDCAWFETETGQVGGVHRKWKPTAYDLVQIFGDKVHPDVKKMSEQQPFEEIEVRHIVMPTAMYQDEELREKFEYVSIFIDVKHKTILEETGTHYQMYAVPRFQTIAGSQYAYSPATVVALPDARLIQAMTHTLLEAGERYARPPMIATQQVIRSDVDLSADGITWADKEYDERMGAALRPVSQDRGGFPIGLNLREDIKETIADAFYLNKLSPPDLGREMTAYEFQERMKAYRRHNLPLFAPMESEYNGQLCEISFDLLLRAGLLGSPQDIPESIRGRDVTFKFRSPLTASEEENKRNTFLQVREMLGAAAELDQTVLQDISLSNALRDAVDGIGAPTSWVVPPEQANEAKMQLAQQQAAAQTAEAAMANPEMAAQMMGEQ